jgi:G:T-mismatch repair DNA endonuclease (very short patch repair protein)
LVINEKNPISAQSVVSEYLKVNKEIDIVIKEDGTLDINLEGFEGKKCSLTGKNNPFYNKKHSKETKDRISKSRTGKALGDNNSMNSIKNRKKVSEGLKKKWASGDLEELRVKFSENMKNKHKDGTLKYYIRSKPEYEIIKKIKEFNLECEPSYRVSGKIFDIYIPKYNLLIEYNGDYWHCNPNKYDFDYLNVKKNKTAKEIWDYDKNKLYLAKKNGYNCIVIWESDYKKNKNIITEIINNYEQIK